jgi:hypothetical protein
VLNRHGPSGTAVFCLALYLEGDGPAEKLARDMATCQQELLDAFAEDHSGLKTSEGLARWEIRPFGSLSSWNRFFRHADSDKAHREAELLADVLTQTTSWKSKEKIAPAILAKMQDLHGAIQALQMLLAREKKVESVLRPPPSPIAGQRDVVPAPNSLQPKSGANQRGAGPQKPAKTDISPKESAKKADNQRPSETGVATLQPPPASTGINAAPEAPAGPSKAEEVKPAVDLSGVTLDLPLSRQVWYFIASLWGAVFTYVLAPLVVDILRRHLKERRQGRSGIPPPAYLSKKDLCDVVAGRPNASPERQQRGKPARR